MSLGWCQRSGLRSLFEEGRWQLSLMQKAQELAVESELSGDWITYVDICHTLRGMGLTECSNIANQCKADGCLSPKLRLKLINTILTGSVSAQAASAERQVLYEGLMGQKFPSFLPAARDILNSGYLGSSLSHYPALLTDPPNPFARGIQLNWKEKEYRRIAWQLKELTISLEGGLRQILDLDGAYRQISDDQSPRVAVVGNSPALLGQGKGDEIDSHDLVIRFNRISAEPAQAAHTGKRTDIWVMSPSTAIEQCPPDAKLVVVSGLHALTRPSFYWRKLPAMDKPLAEFEASVWYELVQRFEAPPSAGTLSIAALKSSHKNLKIHTFGFTTTPGVHGSSPNHHNDKALVSSRHNWQAEINWLRDSLS